jgi:hypothetical protein
MPPRRLTPITEVEKTPGYEWASTRWLRRQVYENHLPSHRVGGRVLIDLNDIDAEVEAGRREVA